MGCQISSPQIPMVLSPFSVNKTLINNKTLTISGFEAHDAASSQYIMAELTLPVMRT